MERLTFDEELLVARFGDCLTDIKGPDDMFPPDGGACERPTEPTPTPPLCDLVELVFVGPAS